MLFYNYPMRNIKRPISISSVFVILLTLSFLHLSAARPVMAGTTVRVGVISLEPLNFIENNVPRGFFIDLLEYVAQKEGWTLEYHISNLEGCWKMMDNGTIDVLSGAGYTPERAAKYNMMKEYIFIDWVVVYANRSGGIRNIFDLAHKKICSIRGSQTTSELSRLLSQFGVTAEIILLKPG